MIIASDFEDFLSYLDVDALKNSPDIICVVDSNICLKAYNDAWISFAKNNNGAKTLADFPLGARLLDAGKEPIRSYLAEAYNRALLENKPFELNYECSSATEYRLFRQTAYPLVGSRGLVISHHLVEEKPHEEKVTEFNERFVNEHGLITQCQNCRKIRDPEDDQKWYWVPSLVAAPQSNVSHGICTPCLDHYYPDID
ncbi:MAG: hypothetical protein ABR512_04210 [Desulfopila sp.]